MHFGFDALGFAGDLFVPELPGIGTFLAEKAKDGIDSLADYYAAGYSDDDLYTAYDDAVSSLDNVLISSSDTSMSIPVVTWSTSFPSVSHDLSPAPLSISDRLPSYFSFVSSNAGYSIFFISSPFSVSSSGSYSLDLGSFSFDGFDSLGNYGPSYPSLYISTDSGLSWTSILYCKDYWKSSHVSQSSFYTHIYDSTSYSVYLEPGPLYRLVYSWSGMYLYNQSSLGVTFSWNFIRSPSVTKKDNATVPNSSTRLSSYIQNVYNYNQTDSSTKYYIGKVDNSNNVTNVYNVNIFDETTNEFRDPYTDKPYQVTNWTYDYAQRIYYLTLADDSLLYNGTPVKHLAIWYANDAMYYIGLDDTFVVGEPYLDHIIFLDPFQYVIAEEKEDSGTGSDGHKHVFTSETTTPPSCTGTGVRTYTCQFCDYSYDEIIPAAGHQWEVTEVKDTEFNDNGDVTAAGYTLYTCAVCGETYRQWSNTGQPGPPTGNTGTGSGGGGSGSGSGSSGEGSSFWEKIKDAVFGALGDLLEAALSLITDVLSAVLGLVKDLLSFFGFLSDTVIKGITDLFSAFGSIKLELPDGVASVFGFFSGVILALPVEVKSLMIFGVGALFLIAIFKMVKA